MNMKPLLFAFLLFSAAFATEVATETSNPHLYIKGTNPDKSEVHTRPYFWFESTVRVGATGQVVLDPAGGTYTDLGDGAYICEGLVNVYGNSQGTWAHNGLYVYSPWTGTSVSCLPNTPQTSISEQEIDWSDSDYNLFYDLAMCTGSASCWDHSGTLHNERVDVYESSEAVLPWFNMRGQMNSICSGTQSLRYSKVVPFGYSVLNFIHTAEPGASHSGNVDLGEGEYLFSNNFAVDGCTFIVRQYPNCNEREHIYSRTSTGSSGPEYSNSLLSDITINVVADEDVGIIPPELVSVDMESYQVTPGQSVPVTILMYIPNRPSSYYALPFEFYDVTVDAPTGATFTETSGINQCSLPGPHTALINGGWSEPYKADYKNIEGTYTVPADAEPGTNIVDFCVYWRSCSGYHDCGGNGQSGFDCMPIEIEIPSGDLPDLICEIEPIEYVDGIPPGPTGFGPEQGVESWQVTITNIGPGDAEINDYEHFFCSMMWFQAWSSDDTPALDPAYINSIVPTFPGVLASGASTTFVVEDATAICVPGEGDAINANSWVNLLALSYPACSTYFLVEEGYLNNQCTWTAPCTEGPGPGECELIPSNVDNPPSEHVQDFDLFCEGAPCTGAVGWDEQDIGDDIADTVASTSLGATAQVITYSSDDNITGTYLITATVGYPDNMICNATITLTNGEDGPGNGDGDDHCFIVPASETGSPGSFHEFDLYCVTDEGTEPCNGYWDITEGNEYVGYFNHGSPSYWADVGIATDAIIYEESEIVEIQASPGSMVCYAEIILPPMDCLDFI